MIDIGIYKGKKYEEFINERNEEVTVNFMKENGQLEIIDVTFLKDLKNGDYKKACGEFLFAVARACDLFKIEDKYAEMGRLLKDFDKIRDEFICNDRSFYREITIENKKVEGN